MLFVAVDTDITSDHDLRIPTKYTLSDDLQVVCEILCVSIIPMRLCQIQDDQ